MTKKERIHITCEFFFDKYFYLVFVLFPTYWFYRCFFSTYVYSLYRCFFSTYVYSLIQINSSASSLSKYTLLKKKLNGFSLSNIDSAYRFIFLTRIQIWSSWIKLILKLSKNIFFKAMKWRKMCEFEMIKKNFESRWMMKQAVRNDDNC